MRFCLHPLTPHWIQGLDLGRAPSVKAIWIIFPWLLLIPPFIRLLPSLPVFVVSCWAELHVSVPIPRSWCHTGQAMGSPREGLSGFSMQRAHRYFRSHSKPPFPQVKAGFDDPVPWNPLSFRCGDLFALSEIPVLFYPHACQRWVYPCIQLCCLYLQNCGMGLPGCKPNPTPNGTEATAICAFFTFHCFRIKSNHCNLQ